MSKVKAKKIKVTVWKVQADWVLDHPLHNPAGLSYSSAPTYVYAHTRQIDWAHMHSRAQSAPAANDPTPSQEVDT